jgi:hypothetical protein
MQISTPKALVLMIAILAGVCLLTAAFVSRVVSSREKPSFQQRSAGSVRRNSPSLVLGELKRIPEGTPVGEAGLGKAAKPTISPTLISSGQVQSMKLTPVPGGAQVAAQFSLVESSPAVSYLWTLRVYNGSKPPRLLSEQYYKEKLFKIALREEAHSSFSEQIALQPGSYQVEVCLYRLPDTFDLSKLADESNRSHVLVACPTQAITVAP